MGRKGRTAGRRNGRIDKAMSHGAAVGFAGANRSAAPRTVALGDAINALTTGRQLVLDDESLHMVPMARDPLDRGGFGPANPLDPAPLDPSRRDTKRPEPRLTEYPVSWNLPGSADAPMPWATLRMAAENVDIMRRCISVRKEQLQGLDWSITLDDQVVQGAYAASAGDTGREDIETEMRRKLLPEIERLTTFWRNPWKSNGVSFEQWVNGVMEDHLVLDGVAVYPRMTYGGELSAFELIDPTTIKLLIDYRGARPVAPFPAFQQQLYGFPRAEFGSCYADDQGTPAEGWQAGSLWYFREEYRSFTPYGFSAVQQALISARLYLRRQGWMFAEYDDGSTPLTFLVPDAKDGTLVEKLTYRTRRSWEDSINDEMSGQTRARNRMKVLMPGMNPVQMAGADERYKPDYDMHLIKMLAGHFGVTSSGLGFSESKGLGNSGLHEGQANVQDAATTKPDKRMIERIVNELMQTYQGAPPELRFRFNDTDTEDQAAASQSRDLERARGSLTLNEDRKAAGKSPFTFPEADMALVKVGDAWMPMEGMAQRAEQAAEAEQALVEDQLATGEQSRELAAGEAEAEELSGETAEKALELSAYRRWARKRGGDARRPFICKALTPLDWPGQDVPGDVDFAEWAWVPEALADTATDEMIMKFVGYDVHTGIMKSFGGGNDNWRSLARDHRGRWVKRGSMRVDALGPSTPDKPVLAGLARDAQRRRTASAAPKSAARNLSGVSEKELLGMSRRGEPGARAEVARRKADGTLAHVAPKPDRTWEEEAQWSKPDAPDSQLPVSDSSSTIEGMTTPTKPKAKRLPDAQHNAVQGIAERYAHNVATLDTTSTSPMVDAADLGIRPATADALVKSGLLERQTLYGFQRRYRLTDAGHAYLAEHTGDTRRAELSRGIADLEAQRAELNANRTAYDRDASNLAATLNRQTMQAEDQTDRALMGQANALRAERAKLAVRKPDAPAELPPNPAIKTREERVAALQASAAAMMSGGPAPKGSMAERIMARQDASVRDVVNSLADEPGGAVSMVDVRRKLADEHGMDRGQQDAVLRRLITTGDRSLNAAPEDNQKTLGEQEHAAALDLGAGPMHNIWLDPPRRSVLDTVRESSEQAAAASAVIDSVPGLREGVARQQGVKPGSTQHSVLGTGKTSSAGYLIADRRTGPALERAGLAEQIETPHGRQWVATDAGRAALADADKRLRDELDAKYAPKGADGLTAHQRSTSADDPELTTVREATPVAGYAIPATPPAARAEAIAASTPDAPSAAPAPREIPRREPGQVKRGDVMVVERADDTYYGGTGAASGVRNPRTTYEVFRVTSATRDGQAAKVSRLDWHGLDDPGQPVKNVFLRSHGKRNVIPGDQIDVAAVRESLLARHYDGHPGQAKPHDDLRELTGMLRSHVRDAPATKPARPSAPAAAPTIESMMQQQLNASVAAPSTFGARHGKVNRDGIRKGVRVQHQGTAWTVEENPRKAQRDANGNEGILFRATREDQGITSTMRLNDGKTIALAAPKGDAGASRPKAEASAAAPVTGAALAAAPRAIDAERGRNVDARGTAALEHYRTSAFTEINAKLRAGGEADRTVQQIDRVMDESRLTSDVTVHRSVGDVNAVFGAAAGRKLTGAEWTDAAYQSTSADRDKADTFLIGSGGARTSARIVMRVPAGTGAVQLSDERYEAELLLQRGLRMRVVSDTGPWRRGQKNPRTIEVEVIPA